MSKEYEIIEEEQQMVCKPAAVSVVMDYSRGDISRAITGEELKARLHEGLKSLFA